MNISPFFLFFGIFMLVNEKRKDFNRNSVKHSDVSPRKTNYSEDSHIGDSSYLLRLSHLWNNGDIRPQQGPQISFPCKFFQLDVQMYEYF